MKQNYFFLVCCLLGITLASCMNESEYHTTTIYYPSSGRTLVYADQPSDTIWFATTESWTVTSNSGWCTIDNYIAQMTNPYTNALVETSGNIYFEPNLTGDWRYAIVSVNGGDYIAQVAYYQAPFLHLTRPGRYYNENGFPTDLVELTDSATWTTDSVTFETFGPWTLSAQGVLLEPEVTEGEAGKHTVRFSFPQNPLTEDRKDTLLLTSRGVTDKIPVRQLALKK